MKSLPWSGPTRWLLVAGLLGVGLGLAGAAPVPFPPQPIPPPNTNEDGGGPPVEAAEVERLLAQLGSESFAERQAASRRLDLLGEPVLAALKRAVKSDDIEVRRRADELIQRIERRLFGELATLIGH